MNESKFKFIHYGENGGKQIHVYPGSMPLPELLEAFKYLALAAGYHPNNVDCIQYVELDENDLTVQWLADDLDWKFEDSDTFGDALKNDLDNEGDLDE
jgi:hypothetical protein